MGGSTMAACYALLDLGDLSRDIYLYDTYEGMVEPTSHDVDYKGNEAIERYLQSKRGDCGSNWSYSPIE
jgi:hypothetical protein